MPTYAEVVQRTALHGHKDVVYTLALTETGSLLSTGGDGIVAEWNPDTGESLGAWLQGAGAIYSLAYNPANGVLAAGEASGRLHFYHRPSRQLIRSVLLHTGSIFELAWRNDHLFTTSADGLLTQWTADGLVAAQLPIGLPLRALAVHPQGTYVAVGAADGTIRLIQASDLRVVDTWAAHERTVMSLTFTPDGTGLISGGRDAHLRHWRLGHVEQPAIDIVAHTFSIHHLLLSPDNQWLASSSMDKSLKIWRREDLALRKVIDRRREESHKSSVNRVCWLPTQEVNTYRIATASDDRQVLVWTLRFGKATEA